VHPLLAAVYFVLTLASANAHSLHGWGDLAWPLSVSAATCAVGWAVAYGLTRDPGKASLVALIWTVAFSVYGYVAEDLRLSGVLRPLGGEPGLTAIFAAIVFGPSLAAMRTARRLDGLHRYLTVVALLLVVFTGVQLARGLGEDRDPRVLVPQPAVRRATRPGETPPDIYLIVLDKYTGGEVLAEHFGFDNRPFERFLRDRGFIVPRHGRANYPRTDLALAAMLNLDYIDHLPRRYRLEDLVENNRLATFLRAQGYRFVFFPTQFKVTNQNRNADLQLPEPKEVRGEFGAAWERSTFLPQLLGVTCAVLGCEGGRLRRIPESAEQMDWKFDRLRELAGSSSPIFVFAHLVLPHEPFLYNADCSHREPYWPLGSGIMGDKTADHGYLAQIGCANRKLRDLVDTILARAARPQVILLQADHGHGRFGTLPEYGKVRPYQLDERMSAFAAYHLPGVAPDSISDSITPVNVMRFVLRHYFGADLPALPDASYWSGEKRPMELIPIR
jgi:hypothetical protein